MLTASLILTTLYGTHLTLGNVGVVTEYRDVYKRIEYPDPCVQKELWHHRTLKYIIRCATCKDVDLAAIYNEWYFLDFVSVESFNMDNAITALYPETDDGKTHSFQYLLTSGECVRVNITAGEEMKYSECSKIHRSLSSATAGNTNGWIKAEEWLWMGVVKYEMDPNEVHEEKCQHIGTWNNFDERFTMKSFNCSMEFKIIVYYMKDPNSAEIKMAAAKMYSYEFAFVEESITIVSQSSANQFKVHYLMKKNKKCQSHSYVLEDGLFREIPEADCIYRRSWRMSESKGYRNDWKKV